jgi:putative transposase
MGRSRYQVIGSQPHFMTCSTVEWMPIFSNPQLAAILLDSLRFLQDQERLTLHSYVIMENHIHLSASAENLSKQIGHFKSFTARSIVDWLQSNTPKSYWLKRLAIAKLAHKTGQRYQVWQEGSHPQVITSEDMLRQKIEYIHNNPVKRGYVDDPAHWRYSSYRDYRGESGLLAVRLLW